MTLLITGPHGFVGSNLVSTLKENHKIYGLDIVSPEKEGVVKTHSWIKLDKIPDFFYSSNRRRFVYFVRRTNGIFPTLKFPFYTLLCNY
jgi:nucleoside-diphosphate-sugar epimerase